MIYTIKENVKYTSDCVYPVKVSMEHRYTYRKKDYNGNIVTAVGSGECHYFISEIIKDEYTFENLNEKDDKIMRRLISFLFNGERINFSIAKMELYK